MKNLYFLWIAMIFYSEINGQTNTLTNQSLATIKQVSENTNRGTLSPYYPLNTSDARSLNDAGVISILSPPAEGLVGDPVIVSVSIKNFGTDTLTNIPVSYSIDYGLLQTSILAGPLLPGTDSVLTFPYPYHTGNQNYTIAAYTALIGDSNTQNDSTQKTVTLSPTMNDVGITQIIMPYNWCYNHGSSIVKVVIKNFGTQTQTSIPLSYQRGSMPPSNAVWTGILLPNDTVHFTFPNQMSLPSKSNFFVCTFTTLANDAYIHNDSSCKNFPLMYLYLSGSINGPTIVNPCTTNNYSVSSISHATYYNWKYIPDTGVTIINQGTSATITFNSGARSGILTVKGENEDCIGNTVSLAIGGLGIIEIYKSNFWLGQNMPNPATGLSVIEYMLAANAEIKFEITNIYGQKVHSVFEKKDAGAHKISFDATHLSAGIYYYMLEFKGRRIVKKMMVNND